MDKPPRKPVISIIDDIEARVRPTFRQTWSLSHPPQIVGTISADDYNALIGLLHRRLELAAALAAMPPAGHA